jgi:hypothetical protein
MRTPKRILFTIAIAGAILATQSTAHATLVNIATTGNLLALLPIGDLGASTIDGVGFTGGITDTVDNFAGTSNQDNGLIFVNGDPDQRFVVTGFNSPILDIRFFGSPNDPTRLPPSLTIYYSTLSTTSINASDSNYTGGNGGVLVPFMTLTSASLNNPIGGATNAYIDLSVNAPAGTQTLLFDLGSANGNGDRIDEVQAFATPEPGSLAVLGILSGIALLWRRRKVA